MIDVPNIDTNTSYAYWICLAGVGCEVQDRLDKELVKETVQTALGFSAFNISEAAAIPDVIAWDRDTASYWVSRTRLYGVIVVVDC
jgi:hypothetical protein